MLTSSAATPPSEGGVLLDYTANESWLTAQVKNKKLAATKYVKDRPGHEIERETIK